jgi:hypothetical protein
MAGIAGKRLIFFNPDICIMDSYFDFETSMLTVCFATQ